MSATTPSSPICIDANLVVGIVLPAPGTAGVAIQALWARWNAEGRNLVAPSLLRFEVTNAVHRMTRGSVVNNSTGRLALQTALTLPIQLHSDASLHLSALDFAARFGLPAAYDAHYLALADRLGIDFWTADQRLFNSVSATLPWVKLVQGHST